MIEKTVRRMWYADAWRVRAEHVRSVWWRDFLLRIAQEYENEIVLIERSTQSVAESDRLLDEADQLLARR